MKTLFLGVCLVIGVGFFTELSAQELSKDERRELKRELKRMEPEDLLAMKEKITSLESQVSNANAQLGSVESRISEKDARISDLNDQVRELEAELAEARQELAERPEVVQQPVTRPATQPDDDIPSRTRVTQGVIFRVQIGAFRNKDLSKYFDNHPNFAGEIMDDGTQQITLGEFRDYWEANTFKKYLREMGVKDAWIVPYKDGERVNIKDVLEGVI